MMRGIVEGHLEITPDALVHLDNCLLCEACTDVCPSGIEMESMGIAFRETVAERSRPGPIVGLVRAWAFGWLFGDLSHFRVLARALWLYQRSGLQWLARASGLLRVLGMRDMEAMLPRIADTFVVPRGQTVGQGDAVQVFAGCMMSTAFAETTEATSRLVAAFGGQAQVTAQQVCCGALQAHSGDAPRARALARQNLAAFGDGSEPIVVNAAGCGAMLKHYGELLDGDPAARRFAARVCDISEFLATRQPRRPPRPIHARVAIQDPCHLLHAQRISTAPRALLKAIPGLDVVDVPERDICCGSAGIYNITHPDVSKDLQVRKCANILATGCETVVTGNPGCFVQIHAGLPDTVHVRHIVDVLAEAYAPAGGQDA